jgi:septin family protein
VQVPPPLVSSPEDVAVPAPELHIQDALAPPASEAIQQKPHLPTLQANAEKVTDQEDRSDALQHDASAEPGVSMEESKPKLVSAHFEVSINVTPTIHTTERVDPAQLSRDIGEQMRSELREAFRGVFADTGMRFA